MQCWGAMVGVQGAALAEKPPSARGGVSVGQCPPTAPLWGWDKQDDSLPPRPRQLRPMLGSQEVPGREEHRPPVWVFVASSCSAEGGRVPPGPSAGALWEASKQAGPARRKQNPAPAVKTWKALRDPLPET